MLFSFTKKSVVTLLLLSPICALTALADSPPADSTNEQIALLVITNAARQNPGFYGSYGNAAITPLRYNAGLGDAAQFHSEDLAAHGGNCDLHNSCNGQLWYKRVEKYYPSWTNLGENVATSVSDPKLLVTGWMSSTGHRANILNSNLNEFGAGIALGQTNFGKLAFATQDFGSRGSPSSSWYPTLPAGTVLPSNGGTDPRELLVNFYDSTGKAPQRVSALVGGSCVAMTSRIQGTPADNGTYVAQRSFTGSGCVPVVFEAVKFDGTVVRYPDSGSLLVGVNSEVCAQYSTTLPTASCGGGTTPPPTTPPPTQTSSKLMIEEIKVTHGRTQAFIALTLKAEKSGAPASGVSVSLSYSSAKGVKKRPAAVTRSNGKITYHWTMNRKTEAGMHDVDLVGTTRVMTNGKMAPKKFAEAASEFEVLP